MDQIAALVGHIQLGRPTPPPTNSSTNNTALQDAAGELLYFREVGGVNNGVHARDASGKFYTLLGGWP